MQPKTPKLLEDIHAASRYILEKTRDKTLDEYLQDDLLRPAVERHFEIIGEAMNRLARHDPALLSTIPDHARIIAFRNVLVHGYDAINHHRVWDAIQHNLPTLSQRVHDLLEQADTEPL